MSCWLPLRFWTVVSAEAAGYTSQAKTVTATKTIGPLDRNAMPFGYTFVAISGKEND